MNRQSAAVITISAVVLPVLGMNPVKTMIRLAARSQEFMLLHEEAHVPHFFSWTCLKGGVISIAIGAVLYLFVVRRVFLRKDTKSTDRYVDLWPKKLDLEDLLYRPLLQTILPFAGVFVCRICDSLVDGLIVLLRKTIYKDRKIPFRTGRLPDVGAVIGTMLDRLAARRDGRGENAVYRVRMRHIKWLADESLVMIRRSLSYGLQLAGVGLVLILLYLLI